MKIQAAGGRLDYRKFFEGDLVVTLDGAEIKDINEADDVEGYVVRLVRDAAGRIVTAGGRAKLERLQGVVVFTGTKRLSDIDRVAGAEVRRERRQIRNLRNRNRQEVGSTRSRGGFA